MTDVDQDDIDRIRDNYTDEDSNLTIADVEDDLDDAGFDPSSKAKLAQVVAGDSDLAVNDQTLNQAAQEAIGNLGDGGAVGGDVIRAPNENGPPKTIGKPENVEQEIRRTGPESGDLIGRNRNTGTEGKIGEVDLAPPPEQV